MCIRRSERASIQYALLLFACVSAFDPDAGLVTSYTKTTTASVSASSQAKNAYLANDGDESTHWMSAGCLPGFYIQNSLSNILTSACQNGGCSVSGNALISGSSSLAPLTDGDSSTNVQVNVSPGRSGAIEVILEKPQRLGYVTVRARYDAATSIKLYDERNTMLEEFVLDSSDNYATRNLKVTSTGVVTKLVVQVTVRLMIWELAALGEQGCTDHVTWDLGTVCDVRMVQSRHWAGHHGLTTRMFLSSDNRVWQHVADLDPNALGTVTTILNTTVPSRYIRIQHQHSETNYAKVYMWELDAYDENGQFGAAPAPKVNPTSLREMLGVNGIWGWGNAKYSDLLPVGQGPDLYAPVASHARNYHNMDWDVTDPDESADYCKMAAGRGTQAKSWLDWDQEYLDWAKSNLTLHVSIQFTVDMFPESRWDNVEASSRRYGEEFARHFGPSRGISKVRAAEVGNEPWKYPASFYKSILDNMSAGLKTGDPNLLVLAGAFQADDKESSGNYVGTRVTDSALPFIDVINFHHYSYVTGNDGVRRATHPEHLASSFNSIRSMMRWRDVNAPLKPLWVTEWGWDSDGVGEACNFPECVSENAAAIYAKRGALLHARYGVQRSTWFFYANLDDCDHHIYCRSGLTGSKHTNFAKKKTYIALHNLLSILGQSHFLRVIREDNQGYVYAFGSQGSGADDYVTSHLVAWQPVDAEQPTNRGSSVTFNYPASPSAVFCDVAGLPTRCDNRVRVDPSTGQWSVHATPDPIIIEIRATDSSGLVG